MNTGHEDILGLAGHWLEVGKQIALATVVETWGSSPRPSGSRLLVDEQGNFEGSVSGGCVEGAVITEALEVIKTKKPRLLEFGVSNETAWDAGLACGGRIRIYVEPVNETLTALNGARRHKQPVVLISYLQSDKQGICYPDGTSKGLSLSDEQLTMAMETLRTDRCRILKQGDEEIFFQPFNPPLRMIIVGAVHIAKPLLSLAGLCHYQVIIIDPRQAFAGRTRFPDTEIITEWPDKALEALQPDSRTAIITLTHDPKLDDPALATALNSEAFYIGALGSRKTQQGRQRRLAGLGFSPEQQSRIHGPVGLDIGALSPAEIAVAIMAEVTRSLRKRSGTARPRITALLLAAGTSSRAGDVNKLLMDVDGLPMVCHAVRAALDSRADEVIVVTGFEQERIKAALAGSPLRIVHNPDYGAGMSTSLATGLKAMGDHADGVIVCLADMPRVTAAHIDQLILAFDPVEGREICVPTHHGKRGNPVLWSRRFFNEMLGLSGDTGARQLIKEYSDVVYEVEMQDPGVLLDIDSVGNS